MTFKSLMLSPNRVAREIERAFDEVPFGFSFNGGSEGNGMMPRVNITETENEIRLSLAIPGVNKEDFKVSVQDDILTISGERKFQNEEKQGRWVRREFHAGSFSRSFTLSNNVDPSGIKADYKNGILEVVLAKREEAKPREIEVKVS